MAGAISSPGFVSLSPFVVKKELPQGVREGVVSMHSRVRRAVREVETQTWRCTAIWLDLMCGSRKLWMNPIVVYYS